MVGSIIGDIVGSIYEFNNIKTKDFRFFEPEMEITDDSILSIATAAAILDGELEDFSHYYANFARNFPSPMGGYGNSFLRWAVKCSGGKIAPAYNSCGNGSAMRIGPVGWAFSTLAQTLEVARKSATCTHNHPEGIKGAQAVAECIFMARNNATKQEIRKAMADDFGYYLSISVEELQERYSWRGVDGLGNGGLCQDSVPQAIICALEAADFEDAVRNAISIGGDSDTIGCITGSIAEAMFGVPKSIADEGVKYVKDNELRDILERFESAKGSRRI